MTPVCWKAEKLLQDFLLSRISEGVLLAAHDLSEGGLLVALSEMLFENPDLGLSASFDSLGESGSLAALLFGESQGRVLVSVSPVHESALLEEAGKVGLQAHLVGKTTTSGCMKVSVDGREVLDARVSDLHETWAQSIPSMMSQ
jgi:Phosphoribosylformylglycinamidine (FGAM) synthase, synthetase domain